jgi:hypothetical protein
MNSSYDVIPFSVNYLSLCFHIYIYIYILPRYIRVLNRAIIPFQSVNYNVDALTNHGQKFSATGIGQIEKSMN